MRRLRDYLASHAAPRYVWEDPEQLGYELRRDPLLDVLAEDEWRAMERRALAAV